MKNLIIATALLTSLFSNVNAQEHPADLYEDCGGHTNHGLARPEPVDVKLASAQEEK